MTTSTIQLLCLLFLASSGVIVSSIVFQKKIFAQTTAADITHAFDPPRPPPITTKSTTVHTKERAALPTTTTPEIVDVVASEIENTKEPTLEACLALNSEGWIKGPRIGNTQKGHILFDTAMKMILNREYKRANVRSMSGIELRRLDQRTSHWKHPKGAHSIRHGDEDDSQFTSLDWTTWERIHTYSSEANHLSRTIALLELHGRWIGGSKEYRFLGAAINLLEYSHAPTQGSSGGGQAAARTWMRQGLESK